jgi:hypothetical protein
MYHGLHMPPALIWCISYSKLSLDFWENEGLHEWVSLPWGRLYMTSSTFLAGRFVAIVWGFWWKKSYARPLFLVIEELKLICMRERHEAEGWEAEVAQHCQSDSAGTPQHCVSPAQRCFGRCKEKCGILPARSWKSIREMYASTNTTQGKMWPMRKQIKQRHIWTKFSGSTEKDQMVSSWGSRKCQLQN